LVEEFRVAAATLTPEVGHVAVNGELDLYTAEQLGKPIDEARAAGASIVVADLSNVSFIDSAALAMLIEKTKSLRKGGGEIVVVANDPRVLRTFEVCGLNRVFPIFPTLREALGPLLPDSRDGDVPARQQAR
jgi:anti-sigma B factor antagonist